MLWYLLRCQKNTESKNPKVVKTKNARIVISSKCAVSKFTEVQEAIGLLISLGIKTTLNKIPLIGPVLF